MYNDIESVWKGTGCINGNYGLSKGSICSDCNPWARAALVMAVRKDWMIN